MTRKEFEYWKGVYLAQLPPGELNENGVDVARLKANLMLTPEQRLDQHSRAVAEIYELRRKALEEGSSRQS